VRLLLSIVAGIVVVDAMVVAGLSLSASFTARRARRELRDLEVLWSVTTPTAALRGRWSGSRRLAAVLVALTIAFWGAAATSQHARHMITSALRPTVDAIGVEPGRAERGPSAAGSTSDQPVDVWLGAPIQEAPATTNAQPPSGSSAGTAAEQRTRPVKGPPTVLGTPSSATTIEVAWSDVSGETGYRVERSLDADAGWLEVATTLAGVTSYADDGLVPGTTYFYRVFATAAEGDSPPSDVVSATTAETPAVPATVVAVSGAPDQIDISWADGSDETGYRVERSADGVTGWSAIATTGQDVTTYSDTGLAPETTYYYRIVAVSAYGDGVPSEVVAATTSPHPLSHTDGEDAAPDVTD
jgi:hypothetical protein